MEYLIIGKVINTHGIKGELRVHPLTNDISRFNDLDFIYMGDKKELLTIERARQHKNAIIIKFKEYDNINDVLNYKESNVYIDINDRVELPEDHFFIFELIGLKVYNLEDDYLGEIVDIIQGPSNDVYLIKSEKDEEIMIPAVKEFVKSIDLDENLMKVDPIEGMI